MSPAGATTMVRRRHDRLSAPRLAMIGFLLVTFLLGSGGGFAASGATKQTATVTGRVTFDGDPAADVAVRFHNVAGTKRFSGVARTDADGRWVIDDAPTTAHFRGARWVVEAVNTNQDRYPAFSTYAGDVTRLGDARRLTFAPGSTTTVDVELVPAASVRARVVDARGEPLSGVAVTVRNVSRDIAGWRLSADDGFVTVTGLGAGRVEVDLSSKSSDYGQHPVAGTANLSLGTTTVIPDLVFRPLPERGTIKARVSRLMRGDSVYLYDTTTRWARALPPHRSPGGTSNLEQRVPPGTYRLVIGGTNVASKKFTVRPGKTTTIRGLKAPRTRTMLQVSVLRANGRLARGVDVTVSDRYGTPVPSRNLSFVSGRYEMRGLGTGQYRVLAAGQHPASRTTVGFKAKKGKVAKKKLTLTKRFTVSGTITNGSTPVRGLHLRVLLPNQTGCRTVGWKYDADDDPRERGCTDFRLGAVTTDENGRFTLRGVPAGKAVIEVFDEGPYGYETLVKKLKVSKDRTWNPTVSW